MPETAYDSRVFGNVLVLEIHPTASISRFADIEDSVRGTRITIGPRCMIDSFVKLKCAGGMGDVTIGENNHINSGTVLFTGNATLLVAIQVRAHTDDWQNLKRRWSTFCRYREMRGMVRLVWLHVVTRRGSRTWYCPSPLGVSMIEALE